MDNDGPHGPDADPGPPRAAGAGHGFGSLAHLAGRFFGALDPRGPRPSEEAWARSWLLPGEEALWEQMSGPDRRHAAGVARDVADRLAGDGPPRREVMASALLHDVGKIDSGLGTFSRVVVTVAAMSVGRQRLACPPESAGRATSTVRDRASRYLNHDRIGADLLRRAGSHPMTVAWACEHHLPRSRWSVEPRVAEALKAADGD